MTPKQEELYDKYKAKNWTLSRIAKQIKVSVRKLEEYEELLEEIKQNQDFIKYRSDGLSVQEIADKMEVTVEDVICLSEDVGKDDLSNYKSVSLDKLQKEYFVSKEKRIETFGNVLKNIRDEVLKRDLTDIPTDKLLNIFLKYGDFLKKEEVIIELKRESGDEFNKEMIKWKV